MKDLTVLVPAYNEESSIRKTIEEISRYNPKAKILVINDASTDRTLDIIKKLKLGYKNLDFISHKKNGGYGAALKTGFLNVKTDYVAFLDADMTYHPKYLQKLMNVLKKYNLDCSWCNRFGGERNKMPFIRKIGNKMLSLLFTLMTFRYIPDIASGERLFKRESLLKISPQTLPNGLNMITAMTKRIVKRRLKFKLIGIEYFMRKGASKLNIVKDFIKMSYSIIFEK